MDAEFENGDFTIDIDSESLTLTLGPSDLYSSAPLFTLSNGSFTPFWSGGKLQIDPTQSLTITSSTFTTNFLSGSSLVGINVEGGSNNIDFSTFTLNDMSQNSTFLTIAAGNFLAGESYHGAVEFIRWTEVDELSISGVKSLAGFSTITSFEIQAIPEPSTYAVIAGVVALGGAMVHRRRRQTGLA